MRPTVHPPLGVGKVLSSARESRTPPREWDCQLMYFFQFQFTLTLAAPHQQGCEGPHTCCPHALLLHLVPRSGT